MRIVGVSVMIGMLLSSDDFGGLEGVRGKVVFARLRVEGVRLK